MFPSPTFSFGNHKFAFHVCGSTSALYMSSFVSFSFYFTHQQYRIFVFLWLTSLCMIVSQSIHVAANGTSSFFLAGQHPIVCMCVYMYMYMYMYCAVFNCSVVSNPLWPYGLWPARLLCPWNFPDKNTGVSCLPFPTPRDLPDPGVTPMSLASSS